ncbi:MAG: CDP-glucose 4,6-dehydratase [Gemmataceae bacterium]
MNSLHETYRGRTILVTGHTGFKGSWLLAWLESLGAKVVGYSLPAPSEPAHFPLLKGSFESIIGDIRDVTKLESVVGKCRPDAIFHLAAQPLVRRSYREPNETYSSNVMGTLNVCEAARHSGGVKGIVVVTSDKVYRNLESDRGYTEDAQLGGYDPYSASKACCEILAASYRDSYFPLSKFGSGHQTLLATVRAGNVIGGGDWAEDRLLPDAARAASKGEPMIIRSPRSIRPWQHVLEPLSGYLLVGQQLLRKNTHAATAWNFGPDDEGNVEVETVVERFRKWWPKLHVEFRPDPNAPHETKVLKLDSTKAKRELGWRPVWNWQTAVERTAAWYREYYEMGTLGTMADLNAYQAAHK